MTTFLEQTLADGNVFYVLKDGSGTLPRGLGIREFSYHEEALEMDEVIPPGRTRQAFLLFRTWVNKNYGSAWYFPELAYYPDGSVELLDDCDADGGDDGVHGKVIQHWENANAARLWFQANT